ncbi:uncharacterized protein LOC133633545 isoform X2 [Entelurus aequoreus]|uniref:uncharacterized protein LOC133633545 isoform X2 n=1 Tax=Entelurus aequoreus TaxID=161455 RepID=UPI002B1DFA18|nr:uncharacterized protein LOC133633545 isoform X2 [Entelurus aequoreus]
MDELSKQYQKIGSKQHLWNARLGRCSHACTSSVKERRFTKEGTIGPSPYSGNTAIPSPYGLHINCQFPYGGHTSSLPPYGLNIKGPSPYEDHASCPSLHDFNSAGPSPNVYNTFGPSPGVHNPPDNKNPAFLAPDRRDAGNPSVEDTISYQPQAENSWTPCDGCRKEFEKILREKQRIEEVLLKIDPGQVRVHQTLCDLVGDKYSDGPPQQSGQQMLFPESGVFISSFRLAAMSHASKPNCMRLFHALFDHFFTVEECQNAVPFGRPGNKPAGTGKRILDRKKVEGILTYVLRCGTLPDWDNIEEAKLKKALVNKCRARAGFK